MAVVKEPVMERKMSQLREGSLSLNPGIPGIHDEIVVSSCRRWYVPIIRKAGFPTGLEPEEDKVFFAISASPDSGFSAMFCEDRRELQFDDTDLPDILPELKAATALSKNILTLPLLYSSRILFNSVVRQVIR